MYYRVYIDAVFLVNFWMDYVILSISSDILHTLPRKKMHSATHLYLRKISGALIGAVWACVVLLIPFDGSLITYFLIPVFMGLCLTGKNRFKTVLQCVGIIYLVTMIAAGLLYALYYFTPFGMWLNNRPVSLWILVFGTVFGVPLIKVLVFLLKTKLTVNPAKMPVTIVYRKKEVRLEALCDTGNGLKDPFYQGEPVCVVQSDRLKGMVDSLVDCGYHLIPYTSVGQEKGLIPVVRLDELIIWKDHRNICCQNPLIALYEGKFCSHAEYQMLLHPELLKGVDR